MKVHQHSPVRIELFFKLPSGMFLDDFEIVPLERLRYRSLGLGRREQGESNYDV